MDENLLSLSASMSNKKLTLGYGFNLYRSPGKGSVLKASHEQAESSKIQDPFKKVQKNLQQN